MDRVGQKLGAVGAFASAAAGEVGERVTALETHLDACQECDLASLHVCGVGAGLVKQLGATMDMVVAPLGPALQKLADRVRSVLTARLRGVQ